MSQRQPWKSLEALGSRSRNQGETVGCKTQGFGLEDPRHLLASREALQPWDSEPDAASVTQNWNPSQGTFLTQQVWGPLRTRISDRPYGVHAASLRTTLGGPSSHPATWHISWENEAQRQRVLQLQVKLTSQGRCGGHHTYPLSMTVL